MPHVSPEQIRSFRVALPSFEEQLRIVNWVNANTATQYTSIAVALREIEVLREYQTRLITDVVTGKLDVREASAGLPGRSPTRHRRGRHRSDRRDRSRCRGGRPVMPAEDTITLRKREFRGSRLRCLLLTNNAPDYVADFLNSLIAPHALVTPEDRWAPRGFLNPDEAKLGETSGFLCDSDRAEITRWWLALPGRANTPNWDLIVPAGSRIARVLSWQRRRPTRRSSLTTEAVPRIRRTRGRSRRR